MYDNVKLELNKKNELIEIKSGYEWDKTTSSLSFELTSTKLNTTINCTEDTNSSLFKYDSIYAQGIIEDSTIYINDSKDQELISLKKFLNPSQPIKFNIGRFADKKKDTCSFMIYNDANTSPFISIVLTEKIMDMVIAELSKNYSSKIVVSLDIENSFRPTGSFDDIYIADLKGNLNNIRVISEFEPIDNINTLQEELNSIKTILQNSINKSSEFILEDKKDNDIRHMIEIKQMQLNQGVIVIATILIIGTIIISKLYL